MDQTQEDNEGPLGALSDQEVAERDRLIKAVTLDRIKQGKYKRRLAYHLYVLLAKRLFRGEGKTTWDEFIKATPDFDFTPDYAYKLAKWGRVNDTLAQVGEEPLAYESQGRAISPIKDPDRLLAAVRRGRELATEEGKKAGADHYMAARKEIAPESIPTTEDESQDHTEAMFTGSVNTGAEKTTWPWGDKALARFKKVPKVDREAVRDVLGLASQVEEVTAEMVDEAATVVLHDRREDGGRLGRLVVVGRACAIVEINKQTLLDAASGASRPALQEDIDYVPGANDDDMDDGRALALPLLCVIPKGMCPEALLDAYPKHRGDIKAKTFEVVVEISELETYGGPVRNGVLDVLGVRDASRRAGIKKTLNSTGKLVGWARFSTNPSTGCDHGCSLRFCYASDLALMYYVQCFVPTIWPARLDALANTPLPDLGSTCPHAPGWDRSVFLGSMTDLMNRSFPDWWIKAVLAEIESHPKWTVFVLTKIAARLRDFDFPPNVAVGVTVTTQREVAKAAAGLRAIRGGAFKWISVEPMLGRIDPAPLIGAGVTFFAVGGQSRTRWSGEKQPTPGDVRYLIGMAWARGAYVYHKDNLDFRSHIPFPGHLPWTGLPDFGLPAGKEPGAASHPAPDRRAVPARGPRARGSAPSD